MKLLKFNEIKSKLPQSNSFKNNSDLLSKLTKYKKALDMFHPGSYYYYILNCNTTEIEFVSEDVVRVLGLSTTNDFKNLFKKIIIHPDDQFYLGSIEKEITKFLAGLELDKLTKYKASFDYRVQNSNTSYIRLLQQSIVIQDQQDGQISHLLVIVTDISHLNKKGSPALSFIGLEGEPSFKNVPLSIPIENNQKIHFTKKEREILDLILEGSTSKQISELLFISKLTVDGHRKSILKKTCCKSTISLVNKSLHKN